MSLQGSVPGLTVIAGLAGRHHVTPVMSAPPMAGQDVVQRQVLRLLSAILAGKPVSQEDVPTGEAALRAGPQDKVNEADDRGDLEHLRWAVKIASAIFDGLSLPAAKKVYGPTNRAYVQRFVVLVQHQYWRRWPHPMVTVAIVSKTLYPSQRFVPVRDFSGLLSALNTT